WRGCRGRGDIVFASTDQLHQSETEAEEHEQEPDAKDADGVPSDPGARTSAAPAALDSASARLLAPAVGLGAQRAGESGVVAVGVVEGGSTALEGDDATAAVVVVQRFGADRAAAGRIRRHRGEVVGGPTESGCTPCPGSNQACGGGFR